MVVHGTFDVGDVFADLELAFAVWSLSRRIKRFKLFLCRIKLISFYYFILVVEHLTVVADGPESFSRLIFRFLSS